MNPQLSRLLRAGFLTGVTDGLFACTLSVVFYHSTVERLFQGVAGSVLATRFGILKIAALYGSFVWGVMSLVVIPMLVHRTRKIRARWWIQLAGHIPFVGVPIVASISGTSPAPRS